MDQETDENGEQLQVLCDTVRTLVGEGDYEKCREIIFASMANFPDAAQPHNLYGLLLEREGFHAAAMKHFRAAWALDPSYRPARQNLDHYGTFFSCGCCAFDESDCPEEHTGESETVRDRRGIKRAERRA